MSHVPSRPGFGDSATDRAFDAVVVGAGFAGLYMLHRLRALGLSSRVYEAGSGVGGTWFWNRYPGARCDVDSLEYSYSFSEELEREWQWTERYASQPEILGYLNYVAERFDLKREIQFETRVTDITFDESTNRWIIHTDRGDRVSAKFCVMATGCLSTARVPDYPGLSAFKGKTYHTGHWPHEGVNFTGQTVGVIGTGSSAIQSIPHLAKQASHLFVFQRTPTFSVPAQNRPLSSEVSQDWMSNHFEYRSRARTSPFGSLFEVGNRSALDVTADERDREYETRWQCGGLSMVGAFADIILNKDANDTAAEFLRGKIREIVHDPALAETLLPKDYPVATKRLCVDTGYYETFNRDNVTLVDLRKTPVDEITPTGLRAGDKVYNLDSIVFATGFDAMTGALLNINLRGRAGFTLKQKWSDGPRTYLGIMIAGFPNLFTITGPGSPSVLSNMALSIEQHVDWIADCLAYLREHNIPRIEATLEAENAWVAHVNEVASYTLFPMANSWYMGANIPSKPRVFMPYIGGVGIYREKCQQVAANNYEGFALSAPAAVS
ncbi:MAG: flavin-containing monooxygenase [Bryobacteraceae bacterium]